MSTYYVANAGSDGASGTDSSHPFQTIAHATAVLAAGDTLLLNRGDRFFETATISDPNVTLDAYGATAVFDSVGYCTNAPIIDAGLALNGWAAYVSGTTAFNAQDSFSGTSGTALTSHVPGVGHNWLRTTALGTSPAFLDGSGGVYATATNSTVYQCVPPDQDTTGLSGNPDYYVQCDVTFKTIIAGDLAGPLGRGQTSTFTGYLGFIDSAGNVTIQKRANGSPGTVATTTVTAPTAGSTYTLKITVVGVVVTLFLNGTQVLTYTDPSPILGGTALFQPGMPGILFHPGVANETATTGVHVSNFSSGPLNDAGPATNTYQVALTTQPIVVDYNGTYCFQGNGPNSLNNNEWFWYQNVLYLRSDAGVPAAGSVIASNKNHCLIATGQDSLIVQNIACEHAQLQGYIFSGCTNLLVQNCYGQRSSGLFGTTGDEGIIALAGTSTNALIQNCVFRQIAGTAVWCQPSSAGPYTFQFNKFYDLYEGKGQGIESSNASDTTLKVWRGNVVTIPTTQVGEYSNSEKGGMALFGDNWLVERNLTIGGPLFGSTHPGNNHTIRDNFYYRCGGGYLYTNLGMSGGGGAIRVADNTATVYTGLQAYRNVMLDCPVGPWVDSNGTANRTGFLFYNNLILNINVAPGVQNEQGTASGSYQAFFNQAMSGAFENNVIHNASGSGTGGLFFESETALNAWTTDYNTWTPDAAGEFSWKGTVYGSLAAYQAGSGRDTNSKKSTPSFANGAYTPPSRPGLSEIDAALAAFALIINNQNGYARTSTGSLQTVPTAGAAAPTAVLDGFLRDAHGSIVTGSAAPLTMIDGFMRDSTYALVTVDYASAVGPTVIRDGFLRDANLAIVTVSSGNAAGTPAFSVGFQRDANYALVIN